MHDRPHQIHHVEAGSPASENNPWFAELDSNHVVNIVLIGLNILASTGVVIVNKWIFNHHRFPFATFLTILHFSCTWLVLEFCARRGLFEKKRVAPLTMAPLCAVFCGFVLLTNLSLQYNSVGFYQCAKILTTPCIALMQHYLYQTEFSKPIKYALALVCVGVGIATVTDVELNMNGTVIAMLAVVVSSLYQVWVGGKQTEFDVNAWQLLHNQSLLSALMLVAVLPFFESLTRLRQVHVTVALVWHISLSIAFAILLNVTLFMVIGRTSAVTYNVAGHLKTVLVLLFGFVVFHYPVELKNMAGIVLTLAGVGWYSQLKMRESISK